jgi:protein ImuA
MGTKQEHIPRSTGQKAMRVNAFMGGARFARLRRRIAEIEGKPVVGGRTENGGWTSENVVFPSSVVRPLSPVLPFAIPSLDRMLAGGLRRDALHEIRGALARDTAAATGFAAAILARLTSHEDRPVLWIVEAAASHEAGLPYGAGLDRFGLDSKRLIVVHVGKPGDALWVFEEGLSCRGLAAVLSEIRGEPRLLNFTASRRLALRARDGGVMGLLLRQTDHAEPGAALTRWLVAPRPATTLDDYPAGIGGPAWRLTLERNRLGATGTFDLEWDHGRCCFVPVRDAADPPHSLPVAAVPVDRPHLAPGRRALVAFQRAS